MLSRCRHLEASEWVLSPGFARNGAGLARIGPSAHAFVENGAGSDRRLVPEATECATHSRTSSVASACAAVPRAPTPPAWRPPPLRTGSSTGRGHRAGPGRAARCRPATGASVACVPEPRPRSVVQVPAPGCRLATGTSQPWGGEVGAGEGIRTLDPLLGKHAGCRSRRHNSDVRLQGNCRGIAGQGPARCRF